jgi:hypothetical protein
VVRIGFSTSDAWISKVIRWWTRAPVSHVFLIYHSNCLGQDMVLDVAFSGFRVLPLELFSRQNTVLHIIEPEVDLTPGMRVVARWLGKPYDWRAFVAFNRWFKAFRANPSENPKSIICTEAVIHALRISGYPGAACLGPKTTTPAELLAFLTQRQ